VTAFLSSGCTLVVPTFTYMCELQAKEQYAQNGLSNEEKQVENRNLTK